MNDEKTEKLEEKWENSSVGYLKKYNDTIIPFAYERGWSYRIEAGGVRILDGLDCAGDHWDGRNIDIFFPFNEDGLKKALAFCDSEE